MERLCDVLEVRRGVTAVIGGGGKTSLLYRLASELRERGMVLVATTTRILPPAHLPVRHDREGTLRALRANGIACAGTPAEGGKLAGILSIDDIARSGRWDMECAQALCGITANICRR